MEEIGKLRKQVRRGGKRRRRRRSSSSSSSSSTSSTSSSSSSESEEGEERREEEEVRPEEGEEEVGGGADNPPPPPPPDDEGEDIDEGGSRKSHGRQSRRSSRSRRKARGRKAKPKRRPFTRRPALASVKIADFTGVKGSQSIKTWLKRIERLLNQANTVKGEWEGEVSCRLGGMASDWYESMESGKEGRTYPQFRKLIVAAFQKEGTGTHADALRAMNLVKMKELGVMEYHVRLDRALAELRHYTAVDEVSSIQYFMNGLSTVPAYHEKALEYQLLGEAPTLKKLLAKMKAWERVFRDHPSMKKPQYNALPGSTTRPRPQFSQGSQQPPATLEQLLKKLTVQVTGLVKSQAGLSNELAQLKANAGRRPQQWGNQRNREERKDGGNAQSTSRRNDGRPFQSSGKGRWTGDGDTICYYCNEKGHIQWNCPLRKAALEEGKIQRGNRAGPQHDAKPKDF